MCPLYCLLALPAYSLLVGVYACLLYWQSVAVPATDSLASLGLLLASGLAYQPAVLLLTPAAPLPAPPGPIGSWRRGG
eukprot:8057764-Alexandrium_andersonii.AAC.1